MPSGGVTAQVCPGREGEPQLLNPPTVAAARGGRPHGGACHRHTLPVGGRHPPPRRSAELTPGAAVGASACPDAEEWRWLGFAGAGARSTPTARRCPRLPRVPPHTPRGVAHSGVHTGSGGKGRNSKTGAKRAGGELPGSLLTQRRSRRVREVLGPGPAPAPSRVRAAPGGTPDPD